MRGRFLLAVLLILKMTACQGGGRDDDGDPAAVVGPPATAGMGAGATAAANGGNGGGDPSPPSGTAGASAPSQPSLLDPCEPLATASRCVGGSIARCSLEAGRYILTLATDCPSGCEEHAIDGKTTALCSDGCPFPLRCAHLIEFDMFVDRCQRPNAAGAMITEGDVCAVSCVSNGAPTACTNPPELVDCSLPGYHCVESDGIGASMFGNTYEETYSRCLPADCVPENENWRQCLTECTPATTTP